MLENAGFLGYRQAVQVIVFTTLEVILPLFYDMKVIVYRI